MLWQEKSDPSNYVVPDDVVDLSFQMECRELPLDHAWALCSAIETALPWISIEPDAGIHSIYGAASGNGWERPPEQPDSLLQLSRRTRLYLRLPKHRLKDAEALVGSNLDLDGFQLKVGNFQIKPLVPTNTVFSRSVRSENIEDEDVFTDELVGHLERHGIEASKLLCGLSHKLHTPEGSFTARSVLLADLELSQSITLQQRGLGLSRTLGCGIFLPHKSLAAVGTEQDNE